MKKSKFIEEQIVGILREAGVETTVKALCAKHNIGEATYYAWKQSRAERDAKRQSLLPEGQRQRTLASMEG